MNPLFDNAIFNPWLCRDTSLRLVALDDERVIRLDVKDPAERTLASLATAFVPDTEVTVRLVNDCVPKVAEYHPELPLNRAERRARARNQKKTNTGGGR